MNLNLCCSLDVNVRVCDASESFDKAELLALTHSKAGGSASCFPHPSFWKALPKSSQVNNKLPFCLQQVQNCGDVESKNRVEC